MSNFVYPVDTDQFEQIREDGKLYVDKTAMIYDIVNVKKFQYVFLARPRRFGKSLLCNTFKAYFQGQRHLFEGLKIFDLEKSWKHYPVFHFNLGGLKNVTVPEARTKLESLIREYENIYGRDNLSLSPGDRFKDLIHNAYKKCGEKVVVIFDEYDAAIVRLMYDAAQLAEMRAMLREFYQVLKDEGAYLRFVFITGVTKFSQLSIFSELNNLKQISMFDDYSGVCGITQQELDTVLRPCVEEYAEKLNITTCEAYSLLKKNYDGYHFSENSQDIYAPYSLLNALNDNATRQYWFETGTMTALIEHLKHYPSFNPLDFDGAELSLSAFDAPCEKARTPLPLLYQSGCLTIDSYDRELNSYMLHFPNFEVRQGMVDGLTNYLMDTDDLERDAVVLKMARAFRGGNLSSALAEFRSYLASMPYEVITKKEWLNKKKCEAFYKLIMYVVFSLLNSKVDTEVRSVLGRADVVVKTKSDVFVLELKVDDTVDNALSQIDDKGYAIPYEADDRRVTKCGVSISSEHRNIVHWRIVDMAGSVVDEKIF